MASNAKNWRSVKLREAALHRWLYQHSHTSANGTPIWAGRLAEIPISELSGMHHETRRLTLKRIAASGKIKIRFRYPNWHVSILELPPWDKSDIPAPENPEGAMRFDPGRNDTERAFNRREALWFWLYGRADSDLRIEIACKQIPGDSKRVSHDLDFLRDRGCIATVRRGCNYRPHVWQLLRPPDSTDMGRKGGHYGQGIQVQRQFHLKLLAWIAEHSDENGEWSGKAKAMWPATLYPRRNLANMANAGLIEIVAMEPRRHSLTIRLTPKGKQEAERQF